jgi:TolB protein
MASSRRLGMVALVAVQLAIAYAAAATMLPSAEVRPGSEIPVTQAPDIQSNPAIFGDVVVWEDARNDLMTALDVWMKDFSTGIEAPVTQAQGDQEDPAIFGGIVVWEDTRDHGTTGSDIWMRDLSTGVEAPVTQAQGDQEEPAIFGDIVVWEDRRDYAMTGTNIWMVNLRTGLETPVTQADGDQADPAVYGDVVIWDDYRDVATSSIDIWMKDLATGAEVPLVQRAEVQRSPSVYGDVVVWSDARDWSKSGTDIWMHDLSTGAEAPLTQSPDTQGSPVLFGRLAVWEDSRNVTASGWDLWIGDISAGVESALSQQTGAEGQPSVYGHLVAWMDERDNALTGEDIYAARIDGPETDYVSLGGETRYGTAAAASAHAYRSKVPKDRDSHRTVVLATGRNWPDALGASALAGTLDAPVLITEPSYVPAAIKAEIARLGANRVIFVGGEDVVDPAVQDELSAAGILAFERLEGPTRYETADAVARRTAALQADRYDGTCFVATGLDFPDALAASPVAAAKGWPVFLAGAKGLTSGTWQAMDDIGVRTVHILGGPDAVSSDVEQALRTRFGSGNVTRQMGATRYETAVALARFGVDKAGLQWDTVAVATGGNFPDALAGGALQARTRSVLMLTAGDKLPAAVANRLAAQRDHIARLRYLGDNKVVPGHVRDEVGALLH